MGKHRANEGIHMTGGKINAGALAVGKGAKAVQGVTTDPDETVQEQAADTKVKVLFVCANPDRTDRLRLDREARALREAIDLSDHRDDIELIVREAATVHDLRRALLKETPSIVHFSGHGTSKGIVLENESGNPQVVSQEALAKLFKMFSPPLLCVLLNACYSSSQGELVSLGVPFTVVMDGPVFDKACIEFSRGFYDAIGALAGIERAYQLATIGVELAGLSNGFVSRLLTYKS